MSDYMMIRHCAPTLAGIKTGSLFSCPCPSRWQLIDEIRRINRALVPKGLRVLPLRYWDERALIYVFRPAGLRRDLASREAGTLLREAGYEDTRPEKCLTELVRRLNSGGGFPHEIGLFLSYPPEDVRGFLENRGAGCKCTGCWKVYGDEHSARARFSQFERCTRMYQELWSKGQTIERLTVAG